MPQPEIIFRHGPCSVAIFVSESEQDGEKIVTRSAHVDRRHRDENGNFCSTNNLRANDSPKMVLCLNKAYEYMTANGDSEDEEEATQ